MRTCWGTCTEISDLGVVAEHCPHCDCLMPCLLRSVCQGDYVLFLKMTERSRDSSCLCTGCLKTFPGEPYWHYAAVVPIRKAQGMELESLLTTTNPVLAHRIHFKEQLRDLGGDHCFAVAYEHLEKMRPGALRADLLSKVLDWHRLDEAQRAELGRHIEAHARAWQFIRPMAVGFPASAGSVAYVAAGLVAGLVFLCVPAIRTWLGGTILVVSVFLAAAAVVHLLLARSVCRWTQNVLIPEAQEAGVSLECVVAVVDDVPGTKVGLTEELWPMKEQLKTICGNLITIEELPSAPTQP